MEADFRPRASGEMDGRMNGLIEIQPSVLHGVDPPPNSRNRSPKDNMWSAIPVALLCMIVNLIERIPSITDEI